MPQCAGILSQAAHVSLPFYHAGAMDRSAVYLNSKKVLATALGSLPTAGDHYLVIFKLIHDMCMGEMSLTDSDISVLSRHVQWTPRRDGERGGGGGKERWRGRRRWGGR